MDSNELLEAIKGIISKTETAQDSPAANANPYVIVRTQSAGVFAGYLSSRAGQEVVLQQARRLWYWEGAATLSELAMSGVKLPAKCKFPVEMASVTLLQAIEIIPCTEVARLSIKGVPTWTA